jgi:hypothetical protein
MRKGDEIYARFDTNKMAEVAREVAVAAAATAVRITVYIQRKSEDRSK